MGYDATLTAKRDTVTAALTATEAAIMAAALAELDGTPPDLAAVSELQAKAELYRLELLELGKRVARLARL